MTEMGKVSFLQWPAMCGALHESALSPIHRSKEYLPLTCSLFKPSVRYHMPTVFGLAPGARQKADGKQWKSEEAATMQAQDITVCYPTRRAKLLLSPGFCLRGVPSSISFSYFCGEKPGGAPSRSCPLSGRVGPEALPVPANRLQKLHARGEGPAGQTSGGNLGSFRNEAVRSNGSVVPLVAALAVSCGLIGCSKSDTSTKSADATPAAAQTTPMTAVEIPKVQSSPGDNLDPLPADAPYPSDDPRDLEGLWVGVGMPVSADGQPPPLSDTAKAESARFREAERSGRPLGRRGSLCRPPAVINLVNQFPIQILQRPDEIIIISEELRGIWHIHMNEPLPEEEKVAATYGGYNVGHWEGNTLVIESIGFKPAASGGTAGGGKSTSKIKVVTRITRANDGDKRNGDWLVIRRTTENPARYTRPYTESSIARWRPDLEMLEFNCEESTPALAADGLVVE